MLFIPLIKQKSMSNIGCDRGISKLCMLYLKRLIYCYICLTIVVMLCNSYAGQTLAPPLLCMVVSTQVLKKATSAYTPYCPACPHLLPKLVSPIRTWRPLSSTVRGPPLSPWSRLSQTVLQYYSVTWQPSLFSCPPAHTIASVICNIIIEGYSN